MTPWLNKKLADAGFSLTRAPNNVPSAGQIIREWCLMYGAELDRWRPVSEPPEIGQWVTLCWPDLKAGNEGQFRANVQTWSFDMASWIKSYPDNCKDWKWKPIEFPEVSDEA